MHSQTRRQCLTGMALAGFAASVPGIALAKGHGVPVDRAAFERYAKVFCAYDRAFLDFYADDVTLEIGPRKLVGKEAVWGHFGKLHANFVETMEVIWFASDARGVAVEMNGSYRCTKSVENSEIFGRSVQEGEVRRIRGIVLYTLDARGKFNYIHGGKPAVISDWTMEG